MTLINNRFFKVNELSFDHLKPAVTIITENVAFQTANIEAYTDRAR